MTGLCANPPSNNGANGTPCFSSNDCDNHHCSESYCNSGKESGDTCSDHWDCETLVCISGRCSVGRQTFSHKCTTDSDCESIGKGFVCAQGLGYCALNNLCNGVTCGSDESCILGECVKKKASDISTSCVEGSDFCKGVMFGKAYHCQNGTYQITDCNNAEYRFCTMFKDGNKNVARCVNYTASECHRSHAAGSSQINECTNDRLGYYHSQCIEDVNGWLLAVHQGDAIACEDNKECSFNYATNMSSCN